MTETLDFSSAPRTPRKPDLSRGHVVLIDGNNLAMRSFHAAKHRMTSGDGVETGSLHLFCTSLSRYLKDLRPSHLMVCWDSGRSIFREGLYSQYKAARRATFATPVSDTDSHADLPHRTLPDHPVPRLYDEPPHAPAFRLITEFLDLTGIEQHYEVGVEADDLIAAFHQRAREQSPEAFITIMSSDKDLLQLLDDRTHQLRFSSYGTGNEIWDRDKVIADLGCTPEQLPLRMALTGDVSDGVPGAKGIGPVKALKLLRAHDWDLDAIAASRPDGPLIKLSHRLVDLTGELCCEVPSVPEYRPLTLTSPHARERLERFTEFCARYQLRELWERLVDRQDLWW